MAAIPKAVSDYMRELGRKGGSVKSDAKAEAARKNGAKRQADKQASGRPRRGGK